MLNPYSEKKTIAAYNAPNNAPPKTKIASFDFGMIKPQRSFR
jgi:hypothetical protein